MSSNSTIYNPEYIIKKGARGLREDTDFGSTRSWSRIYSNTKMYFGQRQILYSKEFGRQDAIIYFSITNEEAKQYKEHETNLI